MKLLSSLIPLLCATLLIGCSSSAAVEQKSPTPDPPKAPAASATPAATRTITPAPTQTPIPSPTNTPSPEPTATWFYHPSSKVITPILLWHHVGENSQDTRYWISPQTFEQEMQALHDWGYTPITISTLADTLIQGGDLPARPVVLTFDDGNQDIFTAAFPIMQRFGFVGTFYIIGSHLGAQDCVDAPELQEMIAAGWEIGSHSMTHFDLTTDHDKLWEEIANSRLKLEHALNTPVKTFAYPFGAMDATVSAKVKQYGYKAAVGLGTFNQHTWGTIYYLSRQEVRGSYDLQAFANLLPWSNMPTP